MPCELRVRDDLSVDDITRLAQSHVVRVTPHVGNWTPARLVLPTLGLSILCVDHTIANRDINAHPHLIIKGGEKRAICKHVDRLTTHAYVTEALPNYGIGTSLTEVHVGAMRKLFPTADIKTHSEHLKEEREITLAVLEEAMGLSRSMVWWRKVDCDGLVRQFRKKELPRTWAEYAHDIFPLTNEKEGWLVHNRIAILMDVVLQSRLGTESEIYHLSGPDMVRYLGSEIESLSRLYDRVRTRLGLPQGTITFNLVPFASFRFATRQSQADACEKLCTKLAEPAFDVAHMRSYASEASDIFSETETQSYFTQHDCAGSSEKVVVPEIARTWSMATCAQYLAVLKAHR
jgi:hypothetical protein